MIRDSYKMKYNLFFCLDDADTKNKRRGAMAKEKADSKGEVVSKGEKQRD
jgi:hypothetical protein